MSSLKHYVLQNRSSGQGIEMQKIMRWRKDLEDSILNRWKHDKNKQMKTQKSNGSNERKVKSDQRGNNVKWGTYGRGRER